MVTTLYGASGTALLLAGSGTRPQYIGLGTGSGTSTQYRSGLMFEISRKQCNAISGAVSQEIEFTADWGSVEMSGLSIREFALFDKSTFINPISNKFANQSFESALTSGTDWAFTTGTNFFSGTRTTDFATSGTNSFRINWFSGTSAVFASGNNAFLSQRFSTSGIYGLRFDYRMYQIDNCFQGEVYVGGSFVGSIFTGSNVTLNGSANYNLSQYTGSQDLKLQWSAISGPNVPVSGLYQIYFDNVHITNYNGGTCWNIVGFPAVNFDGTNELQVQITDRVTPSGLW